MKHAYNRNRRGWLAVLLILALVSGLIPAGSAAPAKKYTVMLYVCGADLERDNGQESASLAEILATRYNTEEINVIALLGGTPRWAGNRFDPGVLSIVDVSGRRPTQVDEMPLAPMSEAGTMTAFLNYCRENYPAEDYILVISDHGGGPLMGCCVDFLFDRSMLSVNALSQALADSAFAERGLDTIAFNCCLMGSLEISSSLAPYARYMVSTEDSMYGLGYEWLSGLEKDEDPLDTAKRIADATYQKNKEVIAAKKASQLNSVAVIDLEKIPMAVPALDRFFAGQPQVNAENFTLVSGRRRDAVDFGVGSSGGSSQYDLADVGSLITSLEEDTAEGAEAMEALQDAVAYLATDVENCVGLTIYHPYLNQQRAASSMEIYAGLGFAPAYVDHVINYTAVMTGKPLASWAGLLTGKPEGEKLNRTQFTLTLNGEQAAQYGASTMRILWQNGDGSYSFTHMNEGTRFENGRLTGEFDGLGLFAASPDGTPITGTLPYTLAPNGSLLIPAELTLPGEEGEAPAVHRAMIYAGMTSEKEPLETGGVLVWDETTDCWTSMYNTDFSDYSQAKLTRVHRKETLDGEGALLPFDAWEEAGKEEWELPIDGSWEFRMLDVTPEADQLHASFEIQDSQGGFHASTLKKLRPEVITPDVLTVEYDDRDTLKAENLELTWQTEQQQAVMAAEAVSLTDTEIIVKLNHLKINGRELDRTAEIYGMGDNWGLLKDERQPFSLTFSREELQDEAEIREITFDLEAADAADPEKTLAVISVTVRTALPLKGMEEASK